MKAAVLHAFGEAPRYEDFAVPTAGADEILIRVRAVPLENIDKAMARGEHFASGQFLATLPAIVGFDGIGELADGRLVGFGGTKAPFGAMAEWTVVPQAYTVPVPEGVRAVTAACVPGSALTALFPLKWAAKLQAGETILVNGATGFAGKLAVQIAKLLGAGRVMGTGRHPASLAELEGLGADAVIDLKAPDAQIAAAYTAQAGEGYDVVLDFLWGHPTEILLETMVPRELRFAKKRVRFIQAGEMAGPTIALAAGALRTSGVELAGAGAGITMEAMGEGTNMVWDWIKQGKLHAEIEAVPLRDVEQAWQRTDVHGKRLVIVP